MSLKTRMKRKVLAVYMPFKVRICNGEKYQIRALLSERSSVAAVSIITPYRPYAHDPVMTMGTYHTSDEV